MKYIAFLLLFISSVYGNPYKAIQVLISENQHDYKIATYDEYKHKHVQDFVIKVKLDFSKLPKDEYFLTLVSNTNSLEYTNANYEIINNIMAIKLTENNPNELFFHYTYKEPKRAEFRWKIINSFEYTYFLKYEGFLYGIAYGIIFCAFLYYLIIYFSTFMPCFLYYSMMQLFVLLSLMGFAYVSYQAYPTPITQAVIDTFETLSFLLTLLFAQAILNTKKIMPYVHWLLTLFILLNCIDLIVIGFLKYSLLYEYLPFYFSFLLLSFVGVYALFKGDKYAIVYALGWFIVCCFIFIAEKSLIDISGIYLVHIGTPLESLIFSFALGYKLRMMIKEKNEKEKLLIHQSKLASMGEMINNIAHQWRQPLTHLGFINMDLQLAFEEHALKKEYLNEKLEESNQQLDFMSKTINNFRDFYKPHKHKEWFYVSSAIQNALDIMTPLLNKEEISIFFTIKKDLQIKAYENELSQVVLNLITNAKEALIQRQIQNPRIDIVLNEKQHKAIICVQDNALGISNTVIHEIFNPYFTTKEKGSGIGLYMSKIIIESHFKGKINVTNTQEGACFTIVL